MTKIGINEVIERLRGMGLKVRAGRGGQYYAQCPAHNDKNPSLSIKDDNGIAVFHCHAGCEYGDIMRALGFEGGHGNADRTARGPRSNGHSHGRRVCSPIKWLADYCDIEEAWLRGDRHLAEEGGEVVFQFWVRERLVGKKFRRAGESKVIRWDALGAAPALWPIPEQWPKHIILCEGETDALVLRSRGLDAYAITKGASTGIDGELAIQMHRVGVVSASVVFDADDAGRKGAEKVRQVLMGAGIQVDVVNLSEYLHPLLGGKDVRDLWRMDKAGADRLIKRLQNPSLPALPKFITAKDLVAMNMPMPRWLIAGLIPREGLTVLASAPKLGKTWLTIQILEAVATGGEVLGRRVMETGKVLYLCYEDGLRRIRDRLISRGESAYSKDFYIEDGAKWNLGDPGVRALLAERVRAEGIKLVAVDTMKAALKGGRIQENEAEFADNLYYLRDALREAGAACLITHHQTKVRKGDVITDLRGTSAIGGAVDMALGLYSDKGVKLVIRGRDLATGDQELQVRFNSETHQWELVEKATLTDSQRRVLDAIKGGPLTAAEIVRATGLSDSSVYRILATLESIGEIRVSERRRSNNAPVRIYERARGADAPTPERAEMAIEGAEALDPAAPSTAKAEVATEKAQRSAPAGPTLATEMATEKVDTLATKAPTPERAEMATEGAKVATEKAPPLATEKAEVAIEPAELEKARRAVRHVFERPCVPTKAEWIDYSAFLRAVGEYEGSLESTYARVAEAVNRITRQALPRLTEAIRTGTRVEGLLGLGLALDSLDALLTKTLIKDNDPEAFFALKEAIYPIRLVALICELWNFVLSHSPFWASEVRKAWELIEKRDFEGAVKALQGMAERADDSKIRFYGLVAAEFEQTQKRDKQICDMLRKNIANFTTCT